MVTLKNIIKEDNVLRCEYFPEDDAGDVGCIEYSIKNGEVGKIQYCAKDKASFLKPYAAKAVSAIRRLVEQNNFPDTFIFMWY